MPFEPGKIPEGAKPFEPGQSGNPFGRPKKYVSMLRQQGYKLAEVNDCIQVLMSMGEKELATVLENDEATVLEKTIAKAMIKSLEKGSLYSAETLLTRVFGKPKELSESTGTQKIIVEYVNPNSTTISSSSGSADGTTEQ